jgi:hypothetical protein
MTGGYIRTIDDMERLYYSRAGLQMLGEDDVSSVIAKVDAPVITSTTGVYNPIYGAYAWRQLNMEANVFGVLPKVAWTRSGWRVITARSAALATGTGVAENAALPESFKPTFAQVYAKPKTCANVFEVSEVQEHLATLGGDDAIANIEEMRRYTMAEHVEALNYQLVGTTGTVAGYNLESLDRICGSYSELSAHDAAGAAYGAGDLDPYGATTGDFNRDAGAGWTDAQVLHNTYVLRPLTDDLIRSVMQLTQNAGAKSTMWLTGNDTANDIAGLYSSQVRYMGEATIKGGINGVETLYGNAGIDGGRRVSTLYGLPIIISKDVVKDAAGVGKSRLMLLDTSNPEGFDSPRLFLKVAKPTQYFEAGMNAGTPFAVNKFSDKGMFRTMGELICTFFGVQGKVMDLS